MKGFVHTIDSLGQLNQTLRVEKENVIKELDNEKGKITNLNKTEWYSIFYKGIKKILKREKPKLFRKKAIEECDTFIYNINET